MRMGSNVRDEDEEVERDRGHCRLNVSDDAGTIPWQWEHSRTVCPVQQPDGRILAGSKELCGRGTCVQNGKVRVASQEVLAHARPCVLCQAESSRPLKSFWRTSCRRRRALSSRLSHYSTRQDGMHCVSTSSSGPHMLQGALGTVSHRYALSWFGSHRKGTIE